MIMGYSVKFTHEAQENFHEINSYLTDNFGIRVKDNFKEKLTACLRLIAKNPHLFPFFDEEEQVRRAVIMRVFSLYYHIKTEEVHILAIINNKKERPDFNS